MSEEIVGQLIGAEGIDLTLIGALPGLAETSTDRLSLESLSGDVAVLDWQTPDAVVTGLSSAGFRGQRAPHPHDTEAEMPPPGIRRVYLFDLHRFRDAGELVGALRQLNARRQVRTFSIGFGGAPSVSPNRDSREPKVIAPPIDRAGSGAEPATARRAQDPSSDVGNEPGVAGEAASSEGVARPEPVNSPTGTTAGPRPATPGEKRSEGTSQDASAVLDLDDLIDQLDRADV